MPDAVLAFQEVWKTYPQASGGPLHALSAVDLEVAPGATLAVVGRSGSGKSTLLHLAAGIDQPTRGRVLLGDRDLARLGDRERTLVRREQIGMVFQFFHLVPYLTVLENVALPAWIAGEPKDRFGARAAELLDRVGLAGRAAETVEKLSGGEMQRVAICRALLRRPRLLLADEPTGNLDDQNGRLVMDLLVDLVHAEGASLVYVTHSRELAARAERVVRLTSGVLEPA